MNNLIIFRIDFSRKTLIESCWKYGKDERPWFKEIYEKLLDIQKSTLNEPLYSKEILLSFNKAKDLVLNDSYSKILPLKINNNE